MKREILIAAALGEREPDLVLKNARVVNVFSGEVVPGDIAIAGGMIAGVGSYDSGERVVDLGGKFVAPGFIDAHVHVESSMVSPPAYCTEALGWGTTTLVTDPHEIANVAGGAGVRFMLDTSAKLPVNYYVQLPSCVPATPFEHAGEVFTAEKMKPFTEEPRVLGLGEMMNYPGVAGRDPAVMAKFELFSGRVVDGHAPGITGNGLQAYIAAGTGTDHESTSWAEAHEKLRAGLAVLVREGSACKNLAPIIEGALADGVDTSHMAFCTDDKHLADIRREGTIRWNVKRAVECGLDPVKAIQMATINAARIHRLHGLGAVAAGYGADLVVFTDLREIDVRAVYKDGKEFVRGAFSFGLVGSAGEDDPITHSVHLAPLSDGCLALPKRESYPVINVMPGNVTTTRTDLPASEVDSLIAAGKLRRIAVFERHHATGNVGVGLIAGYGLTHGAVATTVAHDSHNLIVVGDNEADMLAAVREIERVQGGYTIAADGRILGTLPLPVAGLMSNETADTLIPALDGMIALAKKQGVAEGIDPFITLSFMALPVIGDIRITDMGMFDVTKFSFIE